MKERYILKYFLSARHYVVIDGNKSMVHPHNWQIEIEVKVKSKEILNFKLIDEKIGTILEGLDGKILNDEEQFREIEATTENIGRVLYRNIDTDLEKINCILEKLKISENASRTFVLEKE